MAIQNHPYIDKLLGSEFGTMDDAIGAFVELARRPPNDTEYEVLKTRVFAKPSLEAQTEKLKALVGEEADLMGRLAKARKQRQDHTAFVKKLMELSMRAVEQIDLEARHRAGDTSVIRDETAGNGAGVYRLKDASLTIKADRVEFSSPTSSGRSQDELR